VLKEEGYSLGYIGKWHLDGPHEPYIDCANNRGELKWNEWCPPQRRHGFDHWYAYGTYDEHLRPLYWKGDAPRDGFHYVDQWGPEHEADKAIEYIRNPGDALRDPDSPFALVVSMNPPHTPYAAHPEEYDAPYADKQVEALCTRANIPGPDTRWGKHYRAHIRDYFASVTGVDDQFGRIVRAVDDAGLGENTIIVFTSDHGDCVGIHEKVTKNNHYEESMRIPFLIRWKGRIDPGQDDLLLSTPDIYPTLLDLLGCGDGIPADLHGRSHAGLMRTGEGPRPSSQPYLWVPVGQPAWGRRGVRTHRYTLEISCMPDEPTRTVLHDNREDPFQLKNVAAARPEIVEQLVHDELKPWLKRVGDPWIERLGVDDEG
jgi:arylsulfatase A-like enzyme